MPLLLRYLAGFLPALALVSAAATPPGWTLRAWLSEDGLPNNYVTGLAQTPDGYLWAAMPSGLARFDGVRFESFPTGSFAQQFRHLRIRTLLGNPGLGLCVGVDPGDVVWLNRGTEEIVSNGLPRAMLETVVVDGNGALWVAYHGGSVYRIKDGVATPFGPDKGLPRGTASCALACDSQGRVWYSKGYETGIFSQGRFKPLVVLDNSETRLAAARDGGMWLCAGFRLYKYVEGGKPQDCGTLPGATAHSRVTVMLEDHTGAVWIGTSANGLFRYDGSHFESVPTSDREILALLEDREGNIWAGTGGGGLNLIRPRLIVWESAETGTRFGAVQSLCEDPVATIWGATSDGTVVRHVNGAWQPVLTNSEYASVMANCVAAGSNGNIWIGSRQGELLRLHGGQIAVFGQDDGLESREIHGLLPGAKGGVWICGQAPDSVQYLQGGIFHNIPIPPGAHHLWTLAGDGDGNIWVGGRGVLLRISKGRLKDESALMAGFVKDIRCLRAFQDGSLWMGFSGGGAGRLKNGKFTRIGVAQGLYATAINQIIEDGCGSVWFGSDGGIFRVREKELNAVADGRASSLWSVHYGRSEGIPSVQARYGDTPGALRSRDGRIWMP
ncbi:MAG: hypothetical protein KGR98_09670, partial [Verrucomicrobia bacterium]|nr:hypothetical protein [Verrucomicrobiota bacterium]